MLEHFDRLDPAERIIVALDCDRARALDLADTLSGHARWLKIGMTLFYALGPSIVNELKSAGFKIFLDLKFHDIPHQVHGAARSAAQAGADMLTMHAVGGTKMMEEAIRGAEEAAGDFGCETPVMLAITVLTSMDQKALEATNVVLPVADQVRSLAKLAQNAGASGVVASPQEAKMLRELLGPDAYIVTPGVRPAGSAVGDQSRIATPAQAIANGASHLVIGRPITQADDPRRAFLSIVDEVAGASTDW